MEPNTFETDDELLEFLESYCEFGDNRAYILSIMARPKENDSISHGDNPTFREIITEKDEIRRKYARLKALADNFTPEEGGDLTFRFYISANARDIQKSFYLYQKSLIEMQHKIANGHNETLEKIKRLDKEWESTLQSEGNKEDNYFIIDIDEDKRETYETIYNALNEETDIITSMKTPNGYHIITHPFNYTEFDHFENDEIEIKTDGMMFLRIQD